MIAEHADAGRSSAARGKGPLRESELDKTIEAVPLRPDTPLSFVDMPSSNGRIQVASTAMAKVPPFTAAGGLREKKQRKGRFAIGLLRRSLRLTG